MKFFFAFALSVCTLFCYAQSAATIPPLDKSALDVSYYPMNYPILKIQGKVIEPLAVRVIYSRPNRNGRRIFGGLQDYGEVWRLGANEATEIEFFKDVKIDNKRIKKGRYTMYAIPYPDQWTLIINKDTDVWGSFSYNSSNDVIRINVPVKKVEMSDIMSIYFEKVRGGAQLNIYWEDVFVSLPIVIYS